MKGLISSQDESVSNCQVCWYKKDRDVESQKEVQQGFIIDPIRFVRLKEGRLKSR